MAKKRGYHSESRQARAQETKGRILDSAKKLFDSHGFDQVTIELLAKHAEVSAPTIYALFQSKRGVLLALMDRVLPPEEYEELVRRTMGETSPAKRLALAAKISRQLYDAEAAQLGLLREASILHPGFKQLEMEREKRRYQRQEKSIQLMVKENVLAEGLTIAEARDILWMFTGRDVYRMLVLERGWSSDQYETWLAKQLVQALIGERREE